MKNRRLAIAALVLLPVLILSGQPAVGERRNPVGAGKVPQLIPEVPWAQRIASEVKELAPTLGVEVSIEFESSASLLTQYNILRSVSRMKGIEYYSVSRKRMRTLFAESYVVADPDSRSRLPDPIAQELIPYDSLYMFQEDLTFGGNIYRSEYFADSGALALRIVNLTPMRYLFMPMVQPEGSLTWLIVIPRRKSIQFYGLACARTANLLGLERTKEDSFYNRLKAIYGWFTGELARNP